MRRFSARVGRLGPNTSGGQVGINNILQTEAAARAALLEVTSYEVDLDLVEGATFGSRTTVSFSCRTPGTATWLDLIADRVEAITLNGVPLDPEAHYKSNRISLPNLTEHNVVEVDAKPFYMHTGEGLHSFIDPVDDERYLYTQFESSDARRVFATFEQPDLKASFQFSVTAPSHWVVRSNSPAPEPVPTPDGRAHWVFAPTPRISTYITAIVAGPYHVETDSYVGPNGTYPMSVLCRASLAQHLDAADVFLITKQGMAYFEEKFGLPYPFVKYDQAFVPEFNAGAMENAGCVTHHESFLFRSRVTEVAYEQRANTILHELAHMWFGDLVTMRWWDDIWLNESFAEWASHDANVRVTRFVDAWTTFLVQRKAWAYRQDQLSSTHPIFTGMPGTDSIAINFDGITYAKGAATLRQLVAWVGQESFEAGLREYFRKHAWGNTELADLLDELSKASGRDLTSWTTAWLTTAGVNLLRPIIECAADGTITRAAVKQEPPAAPAGLAPILRPHRIAVGCYELTDQGLTRMNRIELDVAGDITEIPTLVGTKRPALLLLNDDDLTYAKIRLDPVSLATIVEHLRSLHSKMARALTWAAAWDMTRDAEVSATRFIDLVIAGLPDESDITLTQQLLNQARLTVDTFASPANRSQLQHRLALLLDDLLENVEPGSDLQLAYLRGLISASGEPAELDRLQELLAGTAQIPGMKIDTDLRWSLLHRLTVMGRADDSAIDAELERDDTSAGAQHAAQCRAARPSIEAKELAWTQAVRDDNLTNAVLGATVAGFMQRDQVDLLAPFRERYFVEVPRAWSRRTFEMGAMIATGLFPAYLIEERTLADAHAALEGEGLPDSLRRLIMEGSDAVSRAVRARKLDGITE